MSESLTYDIVGDLRYRMWQDSRWGIYLVYTRYMDSESLRYIPGIYLVCTYLLHFKFVSCSWIACLLVWDTNLSFISVYSTPCAPPLRFPQLSSPWPRARVLVLFFIALLLVSAPCTAWLRVDLSLTLPSASPLPVAVAVAGRRRRRSGSTDAVRPCHS